MRHAFKIPIGDWSGDGHGKTHDVFATAAKPIDAVREAYFAAQAKLPDLCPENYCDEYQDSHVPDETWSALAAAGCPLPERDDFGSEAMAEIVAWFLNQGDPSLDVKLDGDPPPTLPFYGSDKKCRRIGFIGYGLLGD